MDMRCYGINHPIRKFKQQIVVVYNCLALSGLCKSVHDLLICNCNRYKKLSRIYCKLFLSKKKYFGENLRYFKPCNLSQA
jgi:hypothetical protein